MSMLSESDSFGGTSDSSKKHLIIEQTSFCFDFFEEIDNSQFNSQTLIQQKKFSLNNYDTISLDTNKKELERLHQQLFIQNDNSNSNSISISPNEFKYDHKEITTVRPIGFDDLFEPAPDNDLLPILTKSDNVSEITIEPFKGNQQLHKEKLDDQSPIQFEISKPEFVLSKEMPTNFDVSEVNTLHSTPFDYYHLESNINFEFSEMTVFDSNLEKIILNDHLFEISNEPNSFEISLPDSQQSFKPSNDQSTDKTDSFNIEGDNSELEPPIQRQPPQLPSNIYSIENVIHDIYYPINLTAFGDTNIQSKLEKSEPINFDYDFNNEYNQEQFKEFVLSEPLPLIENSFNDQSQQQKLAESKLNLNLVIADQYDILLGNSNLSNDQQTFKNNSKLTILPSSSIFELEDRNRPNSDILSYISPFECFDLNPEEAKIDKTELKLISLSPFEVKGIDKQLSFIKPTFDINIQSTKVDLETTKIVQKSLPTPKLYTITNFSNEEINIAPNQLTNDFTLITQTDIFTQTPLKLNDKKKSSSFELSDSFVVDHCISDSELRELLRVEEPSFEIVSNSDVVSLNVSSVDKQNNYYQLDISEMFCPEIKPDKNLSHFELSQPNYLQTIAERDKDIVENEKIMKEDLEICLVDDFSFNQFSLDIPVNKQISVQEKELNNLLIQELHILNIPEIPLPKLTLFNNTESFDVVKNDIKLSLSNFEEHDTKSMQNQNKFNFEQSPITVNTSVPLERNQLNLMTDNLLLNERVSDDSSILEQPDIIIIDRNTQTNENDKHKEKKLYISDFEIHETFDKPSIMQVYNMNSIDIYDSNSNSYNNDDDHKQEPKEFQISISQPEIIVSRLDEIHQTSLLISDAQLNERNEETKMIKDEQIEQKLEKVEVQISNIWQFEKGETYSSDSDENKLELIPDPSLKNEEDFKQINRVFENSVLVSFDKSKTEFEFSDSVCFDFDQPKQKMNISPLIDQFSIQNDRPRMNELHFSAPQISEVPQEESIDKQRTTKESVSFTLYNQIVTEIQPNETDFAFSEPVKFNFELPEINDSSFEKDHQTHENLNEIVEKSIKKVTLKRSPIICNEVAAPTLDSNLSFSLQKGLVNLSPTDQVESKNIQAKNILFISETEAVDITTSMEFSNSPASHITSISLEEIRKKTKLSYSTDDNIFDLIPEVVDDNKQEEEKKQQPTSFEKVELIESQSQSFEVEVKEEKKKITNNLIEIDIPPNTELSKHKLELETTDNYFVIIENENPNLTSEIEHRHTISNNSIDNNSIVEYERKQKGRTKLEIENKYEEVANYEIDNNTNDDISKSTNRTEAIEVNPQTMKIVNTSIDIYEPKARQELSITETTHESIIREIRQYSIENHPIISISKENHNKPLKLCSTEHIIDIKGQKLEKQNKLLNLQQSHQIIEDREPEVKPVKETSKKEEVNKESKASVSLDDEVLTFEISEKATKKPKVDKKSLIDLEYNNFPSFVLSTPLSCVNNGITQNQIRKMLTIQNQEPEFIEIKKEEEEKQQKHEEIQQQKMKVPQLSIDRNLTKIDIVGSKKHNILFVETQNEASDIVEERNHQNDQDNQEDQDNDQNYQEETKPVFSIIKLENEFENISESPKIEISELISESTRNNEINNKFDISSAEMIFEQEREEINNKFDISSAEMIFEQEKEETHQRYSIERTTEIFDQISIESIGRENIKERTPPPTTTTPTLSRSPLQICNIETIYEQEEQSAERKEQEIEHKRPLEYSIIESEYIETPMKFELSSLSPLSIENHDERELTLKEHTIIDIIPQEEEQREQEEEQEHKEAEHEYELNKTEPTTITLSINDDSFNSFEVKEIKSNKSKSKPKAKPKYSIVNHESVYDKKPERIKFSISSSSVLPIEKTTKTISNNSIDNNSIVEYERKQKRRTKLEIENKYEEVANYEIDNTNDDISKSTNRTEAIQVNPQTMKIVNTSIDIYEPKPRQELSITETTHESIIREIRQYSIESKENIFVIEPTNESEQIHNNQLERSHVIYDQTPVSSESDNNNKEEREKSKTQKNFSLSTAEILVQEEHEATNEEEKHEHTDVKGKGKEERPSLIISYDDNTTTEIKEIDEDKAKKEKKENKERRTIVDDSSMINNEFNEQPTFYISEAVHDNAFIMSTKSKRNKKKTQQAFTIQSQEPQFIEIDKQIEPENIKEKGAEPDQTHHEEEQKVEQSLPRFTIDSNLNEVDIVGIQKQDENSSSSALQRNILFLETQDEVSNIVEETNHEHQNQTRLSFEISDIVEQRTNNQEVIIDLEISPFDIVYETKSISSDINIVNNISELNILPENKKLNQNLEIANCEVIFEQQNKAKSTKPHKNKSKSTSNFSLFQTELDIYEEKKPIEMSSEKRKLVIEEQENINIHQKNKASKSKSKQKNKLKISDDDKQIKEVDQILPKLEISKTQDFFEKKLRPRHKNISTTTTTENSQLNLNLEHQIIEDKMPEIPKELNIVVDKEIVHHYSINNETVVFDLKPVTNEVDKNEQKDRKVNFSISKPEILPFEKLSENEISLEIDNESLIKYEQNVAPSFGFSEFVHEHEEIRRDQIDLSIESQEELSNLLDDEIHKNQEEIEKSNESEVKLSSTQLSIDRNLTKIDIVGSQKHNILFVETQNEASDIVEERNHQNDQNDQDNQEETKPVFSIIKLVNEFENISEPPRIEITKTKTIYEQEKEEINKKFDISSAEMIFEQEKEETHQRYSIERTIEIFNQISIESIGRENIKERTPTTTPTLSRSPLQICNIETIYEQEEQSDEMKEHEIIEHKRPLEYSIIESEYIETPMKFELSSLSPLSIENHDERELRLKEHTIIDIIPQEGEQLEQEEEQEHKETEHEYELTLSINDDSFNSFEVKVDDSKSTSKYSIENHESVYDKKPERIKFSISSSSVLPIEKTTKSISNNSIDNNSIVEYEQNHQNDQEETKPVFSIIKLVNEFENISEPPRIEITKTKTIYEQEKEEINKKFDISSAEMIFEQEKEETHQRYSIERTTEIFNQISIESIGRENIKERTPPPTTTTPTLSRSPLQICNMETIYEQEEQSAERNEQIIEHKRPLEYSIIESEYIETPMKFELSSLSPLSIENHDERELTLKEHTIIDIIPQEGEQLEQEEEQEHKETEHEYELNKTEPTTITLSINDDSFNSFEVKVDDSKSTSKYSIENHEAVYDKKPERIKFSISSSSVLPIENPNKTISNNSIDNNSIVEYERKQKGRTKLEIENKYEEVANYEIDNNTNDDISKSTNRTEAIEVNPQTMKIVNTSIDIYEPKARQELSITETTHESIIREIRQYSIENHPIISISKENHNKPLKLCSTEHIIDSQQTTTTPKLEKSHQIIETISPTTPTNKQEKIEHYDLDLSHVIYEQTPNTPENQTTEKESNERINFSISTPEILPLSDSLDNGAPSPTIDDTSIIEYEQNEIPSFDLSNPVHENTFESNQNQQQHTILVIQNQEPEFIEIKKETDNKLPSVKHNILFVEEQNEASNIVEERNRHQIEKEEEKEKERFSTIKGENEFENIYEPPRIEISDLISQSTGNNEINKEFDFIKTETIFEQEKEETHRTYSIEIFDQIEIESTNEENKEPPLNETLENQDKQKIELVISQNEEIIIEGTEHKVKLEFSQVESEFIESSANFELSTPIQCTGVFDDESIESSLSVKEKAATKPNDQPSNSSSFIEEEEEDIENDEKEPPNKQVSFSLSSAEVLPIERSKEDVKKFEIDSKSAVNFEQKDKLKTKEIFTINEVNNFEINEIQKQEEKKQQPTSFEKVELIESQSQSFEVEVKEEKKKITNNLIEIDIPPNTELSKHKFELETTDNYFVIIENENPNLTSVIDNNSIVEYEQKQKGKTEFDIGDKEKETPQTMKIANTSIDIYEPKARQELSITETTHESIIREIRQYSIESKEDIFVIEPTNKTEQIHNNQLERSHVIYDQTPVSSESDNNNKEEREKSKTQKNFSLSTAEILVQEEHETTNEEEKHEHTEVKGKGKEDEERPSLIISYDDNTTTEIKEIDEEKERRTIVDDSSMINNEFNEQPTFYISEAVHDNAFKEEQDEPIERNIIKPTNYSFAIQHQEPEFIKIDNKLSSIEVSPLDVIYEDESSNIHSFEISATEEIFDQITIETLPQHSVTQQEKVETRKELQFSETENYSIPESAPFELSEPSQYSFRFISNLTLSKLDEINIKDEEQEREKKKEIGLITNEGSLNSFEIKEKETQNEDDKKKNSLQSEISLDQSSVIQLEFTEIPQLSLSTTSHEQVDGIGLSVNSKEVHDSLKISSVVQSYEQSDSNNDKEHYALITNDLFSVEETKKANLYLSLSHANESDVDSTTLNHPSIHNELQFELPPSSPSSPVSSSTESKKKADLILSESSTKEVAFDSDSEPKKLEFFSDHQFDLTPSNRPSESERLNLQTSLTHDYQMTSKQENSNILARFDDQFEVVPRKAELSTVPCQSQFEIEPITKSRLLQYTPTYSIIIEGKPQSQTQMIMKSIEENQAFEEIHNIDNDNDDTRKPIKIDLSISKSLCEIDIKDENLSSKTRHLSESYFLSMNIMNDRSDLSDESENDKDLKLKERNIEPIRERLIIATCDENNKDFVEDVLNKISQNSVNLFDQISIEPYQSSYEILNINNIDIFPTQQPQQPAQSTPTTPTKKEFSISDNFVQFEKDEDIKIEEEEEEKEEETMTKTEAEPPTSTTTTNASSTNYNSNYLPVLSDSRVFHFGFSQLESRYMPSVVLEISEEAFEVDLNHTRPINATFEQADQFSVDLSGPKNRNKKSDDNENISIILSSGLTYSYAEYYESKNDRNVDDDVESLSLTNKDARLMLIKRQMKEINDLHQEGVRKDVTIESLKRKYNNLKSAARECLMKHFSDVRRLTDDNVMLIEQVESLHKLVGSNLDSAQNSILSLMRKKVIASLNKSEKMTIFESVPSKATLSLHEENEIEVNRPDYKQGSNVLVTFTNEEIPPSSDYEIKRTRGILIENANKFDVGDADLKRRNYIVNKLYLSNVTAVVDVSVISNIRQAAKVTVFSEPPSYRLFPLKVSEPDSSKSFEKPETKHDLSFSFYHLRVSKPRVPPSLHLEDNSTIAHIFTSLPPSQQSEQGQIQSKVDSQDTSQQSTVPSQSPSIVKPLRRNIVRKAFFVGNNKESTLMATNQNSLANTSSFSIMPKEKAKLIQVKNEQFEVSAPLRPSELQRSNLQAFDFAYETLEADSDSIPEFITKRPLRLSIPVVNSSANNDTEKDEDDNEIDIQVSYDVIKPIDSHSKNRKAREELKIDDNSSFFEVSDLDVINEKDNEKRDKLKLTLSPSSTNNNDKKLSKEAPSTEDISPILDADYDKNASQPKLKDLQISQFDTFEMIPSDSSDLSEENQNEYEKLIAMLRRRVTTLNEELKMQNLRQSELISEMAHIRSNYEILLKTRAE